MWTYTVKFKASTEEHVVRFFNDGVERKAARYYATDRADADDTGRAECARLNALVTETFTIRITDAVWTVLGLDDMCRYTDIVRVNEGSNVACTGTREALISLITEINDRATEDETGYNESRENKAACRRQITSLRRFGWLPRQ